MASLRVLAFDHEGRPLQFDTWLDDLQLYPLSDSRDIVSLFDHTSGAAPAPPATADSATRSQWLTRDAAARLAIRNHLPLAECAHFRQHMTAQALYDTVVARYSSPAIAALGRLLLPYLFPELSASATVEDLVSHLRASDVRYRAAASTEDRFLSLDPTSLTVDLLEQHLLAAETNAVVVGAARGTPRTPFFEGCSPSPLAPSYASAAAVDVLSTEDVGAASASAKHCSGKGKGGRRGGGGSGSGGGGSSGGSGGSGGGGSGGSGGGSGGVGGGGGGSSGSGGSGSGGSCGGRTGARRGAFEGGQRVSCSYVIRMGDCAGQTCGKSHTQHRCFSHFDNAWRVEFGDEVECLHWAELLRSSVAIFDLDYDAILSAMYALSASAEGDCCHCVPPDPSIEAPALGASESSLPGTTHAEAFNTFTLDSDASRYFFVTAPPSLLSLHLSRLDWLTPPGAQSLPVPPLSSRVWQFRPAHCQVFTSPSSLRTWSLPPLPPSPAPPCLPCVVGLQRAAPHSSSFPPTTAPLQTLHMDVWGPARVSGQGHERYFLLVVDDYTRYTTVFPLRSKGQVVDVLIPWIRTVRLHLRKRFHVVLPVLHLCSDRGGEFSSDHLRDFCRGEGIL
ncbi:unnamed protein product [Closterium sp. NIES-53]